MGHTTLVDTNTVAQHLSDPSWAIVDCRFELGQPAWAASSYAAGHIPGAVFADLERDLSGPKTGANGRHPLPDPAALAHTFGRLGIDSHTQVVAYDQNIGMFAGRLWWMLRWLGHANVAVLDGGLAKWIGEGRQTTDGVESRPPRVFIGTPRPEMIASAADIVQHSSQLAVPRSLAVIDARAPERYRGDVEPIDRVGGHIPGATNRFFKSNVAEAGVLRTAEELRAEWAAQLQGTAPEDVVCYCGSGVTACHNLLAMEVAGLGGARLYPGSWSEWSSDPSRPVARGDNPE